MNVSIERKISVVAMLARAWDGSPLTHRLATMATQMRPLFIERCLLSRIERRHALLERRSGTTAGVRRDLPPANFQNSSKIGSAWLAARTTSAGAPRAMRSWLTLNAVFITVETRCGIL